MFNKNKKEKKSNQNESRTKIKQETLFTNLINRVKKITKEEELKVEKREVTKDDKKAIIITIRIRSFIMDFAIYTSIYGRFFISKILDNGTGFLS